MAGENITLNVGSRGLEADIIREVNSAQRTLNRRPLRLQLDAKGFRQPLGRITGDMNEFQKSLDASVARTFAFGAAVGVVAKVADAFKALTSATIEVQAELANINVLLGLSSSALSSFSSDLFKVAQNTAQAFKTVAVAATEFSRQGLSAEETLKRVNDAMILTRLSGLGAEQAVASLTAAINGFRREAITSTEVVNRLANVDAQFAVSSKDLADALARAGSTAQGAKVQFNELLAAVTSVQQQTARGGAVIGNAFKSIFTRIQRSGVQDALEEIGVSTRTLDGSFRSGIAVIKDYARVYDSLTDAQKAYTSEQIAGVFQINNLRALVNDLNSSFSIYDRALRVANGSTNEATQRNKELNQTLSALLAQTTAALQGFGAALGNLGATEVIGRVLRGVKALSEFISKVLDPEEGNKFAQGFVKGIGSFIAGPGLIIIGGAFLKLFTFISKQAGAAVKQIFAINTETQRQQQLQQAILAIVTSEEGVYRQILANAGNQAAQEKIILDTLRKQTAQRAQQQKFLVQMASSSAFAGLGVSGGIIAPRGGRAGSKARAQGLAGGYVPNFATAMANTDEVLVRNFAATQEAKAIRKGVGGASPGARVAQIGFNPARDAILNPDMVAQLGLPAGAQRINAAGGFIPNFAKKEKRGLTQTISIGAAGSKFAIVSPARGGGPPVALPSLVKGTSLPKGMVGAGSKLDFAFGGGQSIPIIGPLGRDGGANDSSALSTAMDGNKNILQDFILKVTEGFFGVKNVKGVRRPDFANTKADALADKSVMSELMATSKGPIFEAVLRIIQGDLTKIGGMVPNAAIDINPASQAQPNIRNFFDAPEINKFEAKTGKTGGSVPIAKKYIRDILTNVPSSSVDPQAALAAQKATRQFGKGTVGQAIAAQQLATQKKWGAGAAAAGEMPAKQIVQQGEKTFALIAKKGGFTAKLLGRKRRSDAPRFQRYTDAAFNRNDPYKTLKLDDYKGYGGLAQGFLPNFAASPITRAMKTERAMGGRPVLDFDPEVGYFVRDGKTQANFAAVKGAHPEGIAGAILNSQRAQGVAALGFIPNFQELAWTRREETSARRRNEKMNRTSGGGMAGGGMGMMMGSMALYQGAAMAPQGSTLAGGLMGAGMGMMLGGPWMLVGAAIGALATQMDPLGKSAEKAAKELAVLTSKQKLVSDGLKQYINLQGQLSDAIKEGNLTASNKVTQQLRTALADLSTTGFPDLREKIIGAAGDLGKLTSILAQVESTQLRTSLAQRATTSVDAMASAQQGRWFGLAGKDPEKATAAAQDTARSLSKLLETAPVEAVARIHETLKRGGIEEFLKTAVDEGLIGHAQQIKLAYAFKGKDMEEVAGMLTQAVGAQLQASEWSDLQRQFNELNTAVMIPFKALGDEIVKQVELLESRFKTASEGLKNVGTARIKAMEQLGIIDEARAIELRGNMQLRLLTAKADKMPVLKDKFTDEPAALGKAFQAGGGIPIDEADRLKVEQELTEQTRAVQASVAIEKEILRIQKAAASYLAISAQVLTEDQVEGIKNFKAFIERGERPGAGRESAESAAAALAAIKNVETLTGADFGREKRQARTEVAAFNMRQLFEGMGVAVEPAKGVDEFIKNAESALKNMDVSTAEGMRNQRILQKILHGLKEQQKINNMTEAEFLKKQVADAKGLADTLGIKAGEGGVTDEFALLLGGLDKGEKAQVLLLKGIEKQSGEMVGLLNDVKVAIEQAENKRAALEAMKARLQAKAQGQVQAPMGADTVSINAQTVTVSGGGARTPTAGGGFVPTFSPLGDKVRNAMETEKRMGGTPMVGYHPSVGVHVRDRFTQRNFSQVRRDHPEGLRNAVANSASLQGAMGMAGVPNFAQPTGAASFGSFLQRGDNAFVKLPHQGSTPWNNILSDKRVTYDQAKEIFGEKIADKLKVDRSGHWKKGGKVLKKPPLWPWEKMKVGRLIRGGALVHGRTGFGTQLRGIKGGRTTRLAGSALKGAKDRLKGAVKKVPWAKTLKMMGWPLMTLLEGWGLFSGGGLGKHVGMPEGAKGVVGRGFTEQDRVMEMAAVLGIRNQGYDGPIWESPHPKARNSTATQIPDELKASKNPWSSQQLKRKINAGVGVHTAERIGGFGGSIIGGVIGGALGGLFGPTPAAWLVPIMAALGAWGGSYVGGYLANKIIGPQAKKHPDKIPDWLVGMGGMVRGNSPWISKFIRDKIKTFETNERTRLMSYWEEDQTAALGVPEPKVDDPKKGPVIPQPGMVPPQFQSLEKAKEEIDNVLQGWANARDPAFVQLLMQGGRGFADPNEDFFRKRAEAPFQYGRIQLPWFRKLGLRNMYPSLGVNGRKAFKSGPLRGAHTKKYHKLFAEGLESVNDLAGKKDFGKLNLLLGDNKSITRYIKEFSGLTGAQEKPRQFLGLYKEAIKAENLNRKTEDFPAVSLEKLTAGTEFTQKSDEALNEALRALQGQGILGRGASAKELQIMKNFDPALVTPLAIERTRAAGRATGGAAVMAFQEAQTPAGKMKAMMKGAVGGRKGTAEKLRNAVYRAYLGGDNKGLNAVGFSKAIRSYRDGATWPGDYNLLANLQGGKFGDIYKTQPANVQEMIEGRLKRIFQEKGDGRTVPIAAWDLGGMVDLIRSKAVDKARLTEAKKLLTRSVVGKDVEINEQMMKATLGFGGGFVPTFNKFGEVASSVAAGYAKPVGIGDVKSINIPGVGRSYYNNQEKVLHGAGMRQPFIVPPYNSRVAPQYKNKVEDRFGFNPYKAASHSQGFIPNFKENAVGDNKALNVKDFDLALKEFDRIVGAFKAVFLTPTAIPLDVGGEIRVRVNVPGLQSRIAAAVGGVIKSHNEWLLDTVAARTQNETAAILNS
mgnify:FL=1